jgi:hypothetical protein
MPDAGVAIFVLGPRATPGEAFSEISHCGGGMSAARMTKLPGGFTVWLVPASVGSCMVTIAQANARTDGAAHMVGAGCGYNAAHEKQRVEESEQFGPTQRII